jgi:arylsulfatase
LAAKYPDKLAELKKIFDEEAEKNPLDDRGAGRAAESKPSLGGADPNRTSFTYYAERRVCLKLLLPTPRTVRIVSRR